MQKMDKSNETRRKENLASGARTYLGPQGSWRTCNIAKVDSDVARLILQRITLLKGAGEQPEESRNIQELEPNHNPTK